MIDCSIESKLYLTSARALVPELPLTSSCVVQHQISDLFVVTLEMRYLMTQGTFGARISGAVDHMHPAWSIANEIRPRYVPWITSYNHRSMNVDFRPFRRYPRNAISHDAGHFRSSDFVRARSYAPCMIDCKRNPTSIRALDHELQPSQHERRFSTFSSLP